MYCRAGRGAGGPKLHGTRTPEDASIYLDGKFIGTLSDLKSLQRGLWIQSGGHSLAIVRPGYKTREVTLIVIGGDSTDVEVELQPS
jgi:hypothetical protein